jgi:3-dehydroquinate synthase
VAILTQPSVTPRAVEIGSRLNTEGLATEVVGVPDRDEAKTLAVVESVYEALARFGLNRSDTVVGVGGGALTDVAGFVAGTWLRGVEVVHFPTTLLAAVDASLGGKTGVNLAGKNLVGVIWHPTRVVADLSVIRALPSTLLREGMAEAYKVGLVGDPVLAELISVHGLSAPLDEVVLRAASVKTRIVNEDDREHGVRAYLNFGHTIGHAIEFASPLSHGESVGLGMIAAAHISQRLSGFHDSPAVEATVERIGLPTEIEGLDRARIHDLLRHDKKRDSHGLRMVLLNDVGSPVIAHVGEEDVDYGLTAVGI